MRKLFIANNKIRTKLIHRRFCSGQSLNYYISILFLLVLFFPRNKSAFPELCELLKYIDLLAVLWAVIILLKLNYYTHRNNWYIILPLPWYLICTVVNNSGIRVAATTCYKVFAIVLICDYVFHKDLVKAVIWIARIWALFLVIEAISYYTHCFGYTFSGNTGWINNYFFGIRVEINQYVIYGIAYNLYAALLGKKRELLVAFIAILSSVYFVFSEFVSTSVVGIIVFFAVLITTKLIRNQRFWDKLIKAVFVASLSFVILYTVIRHNQMYSFIMTSLLRKDITLNGRVILWEQAIQQMTGSHWLFGYGFEPVFSLSIGPYFRVNHPHNQYLQFLYDFGVIGLVSYLCILIKMIRDVITTKEYGVKAIGIATIISTLLMCISSRNYWYMTSQAYYVMLGFMKTCAVSKAEIRKK